MKLVFLLLSLATTALAGSDIPELLKSRILKDSLIRSCWGKESIGAYVAAVEASADRCLTKLPEFTAEDAFEEEDSVPPLLANAPPKVAEVLKAVGLPSPRSEDESEEETEEESDAAAERIKDAIITGFREGFDRLKGEKALKISNFTCVMKEMNMWNEDDTINMDYYRNMVFEGSDLSEEFKKHNLREYEKCFQMSNGVKQFMTRARNPVVKKFGSQIFFNKCVITGQAKVCLQKHLLDSIEEGYHIRLTPEIIQRLGLPSDRYEAALIHTLVTPRLRPKARRFALDMAFYGIAAEPYN